jgi:arginine decarboxylase
LLQRKLPDAVKHEKLRVHFGSTSWAPLTLGKYAVTSWTEKDSAHLYHIQKWGAPYFTVTSEGNLACHPTGASELGVDLKTLMEDLRRRGIDSPILIRFNDILGAQISNLRDSFLTSMKNYGYSGHYQPVMPIKVNQQRHVAEELLARGKDVSLGLEAGSKPELLIGLALLETENSLLICNGYKDREYIEMALHGQGIIKNPILVLDRFAELDTILEASERLKVRPCLGVRMKLAARGAGKWQESSGDWSKFGLSASEMVATIRRLEEKGMLDCLTLLHFHIGSQITNIRAVKDAVREATQVYADLRDMGATNLSYMDVGGGLAIDYDGSQTNFHSSRNYSVQEYANDVVSAIQDGCDDKHQPHPTIITEAGRALVAHHSVLVFNIVGTHTHASEATLENPPEPCAEDHDMVHAMWEAYQCVSSENFQEAYNDAIQLKEESVTLFGHGVFDLSVRAKIEDLFWATLTRIQETVRRMEYVSDDLKNLDQKLADIYYGNFSIFQSLPDSWAVNQLFPIVPLQRLNEEPTRDTLLADLTCDSDGRIKEFIDLRDTRDTLRLHPLTDDPYYLGVFLVGAYQETLGDLHNLFGDTNAVHVSIANDGSYQLEHVVQGDRVSEVLSYVEYDKSDLVNRVRRAAEQSVRAGDITFEQSAALMKSYIEGLAGYTYLEEMD